MTKETIKVKEATAKESTKIKEKLEETDNNKEGKVGTMLRDVRTKKKLTIDDVANDLRIKTAYLTAIEDSDYDNIPEAPYGIGFVRSYASYLGLNSTRIAQIFKEETQISPTKTVSNAPILTDEIIEENNPMALNRKYIAMSFILLVLCYLLWLTLTPSNNVNEILQENEITSTQPTNEQEYPLQVENFSEETETTIEEEHLEKEIPQITVTDDVFVDDEEKPIVAPENKTSEKEITSEELKKIDSEKPDASLKNTKEETEQKNISETAPKKTGRVVLKVKKETWIEVKDENKLWISKVLQAGDEYVLPENGVGKTVSFGNTDGVDVIIDGKVVTVVSNNKKTNINMDAFLGAH